ncbi:GPI-anchored surface protein, putative [Bodo saltans]|uniref:GPI-anchored surface protein, putative n=1 Tax=Bodo saltans TaxID=75058 RepID=A0A0S4IVT5_BODSA|nr:GPI-anchored surface protein, putative [Bodo saltans]|eukprot:CUG05045.1 GPI-anchored surface protein, putative [Bodo saltans]
MLSRDGEILLLDHQPHHVGGREDSVVLWPHLAHRAVAALSRYHSTFGHWTSSTAGASGVPGVDPDECRKADVDRKALTHGVFSPGLVVALSRSLPQTRRPIVERAETFALLLLLSDFVFQRRCRKRHQHHHATHHHPHRAGTPQEQRTTRDASVTTPPPSSSLVDDLDVFVANVVAAVKSPSTSMASRNASMVAIPSHQPAADDTSAADHVSVGTNPASLHSSSLGVEYVAPSLALHKIPANIPPFFMKALQRSSDHGELLLGAFAAKAVRRTLRVPHCPPHVLHRMMCRWSPYIVPTSLVFSNAIFLRRTVSSLHNTNDDVNIPGAQRSGHDGSFMLDEDHEDEHLQSPTSYRQHDQQRQTRCLVFSEIVDSKDDASSVGATTPISGTMLVHVCVVSSEDLLVVAHFINTILRAACQVLDYSFPGLSWSVEGVPQSTGPQNSLTCDDDDDVFLDIPSVSALDAMFSDPSLPASEQQFADADTEAAATLLLTKASL